MGKARVAVRLKEALGSEPSQHKSEDLVRLKQKYDVFRKELKGLVNCLKSHYANMLAVADLRYEVARRLAGLATETPLSEPVGKLKESDQSPGSVSSYLSIHETISRKVKTNCQKYSELVEYTAEWHRVAVGLIDPGLKKTEDLRVELVHYDAKVETLQQSAKKTVAKKGKLDAKSQEKLARNEVKRTKIIFEHSKSTADICATIEEVVERSFVDLYPLLIKLAQFDVTLTDEDSELQMVLKNVITELERLAATHKISPHSRLKHLEQLDPSQLKTISSPQPESNESNSNLSTVSSPQPEPSKSNVKLTTVSSPQPEPSEGNAVKDTKSSKPIKSSAKDETSPRPVATPITTDSGGQTEPSIFRFLTANQILEIPKIEARQALPISPQIRSLNDDDALLYVFVSHRWMEPQSPDADGSQLKTIQTLFRYVEELTNASLIQNKPLSWPKDLHSLVEGMPQAASLVSRMRFKQMKPEDMNPDWYVNPLDYIYVWYDCLCLPQNFPLHGISKTEEDRAEFKLALQNLDILAQRCELVYLETRDYYNRAWCSFEHFQKSIVNGQGHVGVDCDKVLQRQMVDWCLVVERQQPDRSQAEVDFKKMEQMMNQLEPTMRNNPAVQQMMQKAKNRMEGGGVMAMAEKTIAGNRKGSFDNGQINWDYLIKICKKNKGGKKRKPHYVPDLTLQRLRILNAKVTASELPPLVSAVDCLARELYTAVFTMSCRDAISYQKNPPLVEPNLNQCPNYSTGMQCGLHDHRLARSTDQQKIDLQQCIETGLKSFYFGSLVCPNKAHRLQPNVASTSLSCYGSVCQEKKLLIQPGHVHASCFSCDYDICYFCATGQDRTANNDNAEFDPSSQEDFDKLFQKCQETSIPDESKGNDAFVVTGIETETLCERRVTIDLVDLTESIFNRFGLKCTNRDDTAYVGLLALRNILSGSNSGSRSNNTLRVSAGSLRFVEPVIRKAVEWYADMLAHENKVFSLYMTFSLKVPRWVLLDMASSKLGMTTTLYLEDSFLLGTKVQDYLEQNHSAISCLIDTKATPLNHRFCKSGPTCLGGWSTCQHETQRSLTAVVLSATSAPSTLDPWATIKCPTKLASFLCFPGRDKLYVISGANGDEDPETKGFTTCLNSTFFTELPLSIKTQWKKGPDLITARRNAAGCLQRDNDGNVTAILVAGGKGTTLAGTEAKVLSTIEVLKLGGDRKESDLKWESFGDLPRPRSSGHMVSVGKILFVFGGRTNNGQGINPEGQKCDIFYGEPNKWLEGPLYPEAVAAGSLVVLRNRFVFVLGGVQGTKAVAESWVIDLKPWVEWVISGHQDDQKPSSTWITGPCLPRPMASPNACLATQEETCLPYAGDWLLCVAPLDMGNFVIGMRLPPVARMENPDAVWDKSGIQVGKFRYLYRWQRLSNTPDAFSMGAAFVSQKMLGIIGGVGLVDTGKVTDNVHFRMVSMSSNTVLPVAQVEVSQNDVSGGIQRFAKNFDRNQKIELNDLHLIGRLGFPLEEQDIFAKDGTKKLRVLDPQNKHCQRCLVLTQSLAVARSSKDTTLFGIKPQKNVSGRMVPLCSRCLCEIYYNKRQT